LLTVTVMTEQRPSTLRQLLRRPVFTGGALVLCLGFANWVVGNAKLAQYGAMAMPTAIPSDRGVVLSSGFTFSDVSESHERSNIAAAKVKYYSVVLIAGELLSLVGLAMTIVGYLQLRGAAAAVRENKTLLDSTPGAT
jgi:hypothetical protein